MQPTITRETVPVERRQSILRWSAVLAGAACSIGFWILLQLLGVGLGLAAVDIDDVRSLRGAGIGTTLWSLASPLIAMFLGGVVAGHLAQTYDRKLAGVHGMVMWALTSIVGLCATIWIVTMVASGVGRHRIAAFDTGSSMTLATPDDSVAMRELGLDTGELLAPINERLADKGKPTITAEEFSAAMRGVVRSGIARGSFEQELLVDQLVANTPLSRADATEVERQIEARLAPDTGPHALERRAERYVLGAVDSTGKALTGVGLSLLLSLVASVLGALVALRRWRRSGEAGPRRVRTTEPGFPAPGEPVTTSPPVPPGTPVAPARAGNDRIIVPPTD
jgi:hypothetical protein